MVSPGFAASTAAWIDSPGRTMLSPRPLGLAEATPATSIADRRASRQAAIGRDGYIGRFIAARLPFPAPPIGTLTTKIARHGHQRIPQTVYLCRCQRVASC